MKTKLRFTRGELMAVLFMLVIILSSNIVYYFYKPNPKIGVKMDEYALIFEEIVKTQKFIEDSIADSRLKGRFFTDSVPKLERKSKQKMYEIVKLDVNSCDTNDLVVVPQFGSKRALKLVEYRDRLGGFYSLSQLQEIYILQNIDTNRLKEFLYCKSEKIRKININTASYKEMVAHPYLDSYLTKMILKHRETKGIIKDLDELQEITHAYPELINRLSYYVCF